MKHTVPKRRNPYDMLNAALAEGWSGIETMPLAGEGEFLVMTMSGLIRLARNRRSFRSPRRADGYGPQRMTVTAVESGNYLAAIAWKWPDEKTG